MLSQALRKSQIVVHPNVRRHTLRISLHHPSRLLWKIFLHLVSSTLILSWTISFPWNKSTEQNSNSGIRTLVGNLLPPVLSARKLSNSQALLLIYNDGHARPSRNSLRIINLFSTISGNPATLGTLKRTTKNPRTPLYITPRRKKNSLNKFST